MKHGLFRPAGGASVACRRAWSPLSTREKHFFNLKARGILTNTTKNLFYPLLLILTLMFGVAHAGPGPAASSVPPAPPAPPPASASGKVVEAPAARPSPSIPAKGRAGLIERGDLFFRLRGAHHVKDRAVPANVRNALDLYLQAYDAGPVTEGLITRILHATYFYVTYAETDRKLAKKAVDRALEIGKKGLKEYPGSAGINYWMASIWAAWSRVHGHFASAGKDIAGKIRALARKTIEIDPAYNEGGGYRTLGRLHYKTPHIPFFLSWPDKNKALKLLKKAVEVAPENLTNHLFYAESLLERGYRDRARKEVEFIIKARIREENVVEELRVKKRAAALLPVINDRIDVNMRKRSVIE